MGYLLRLRLAEGIYLLRAHSEQLQVNGAVEASCLISRLKRQLIFCVIYNLRILIENVSIIIIILAIVFSCGKKAIC